MKLKEGLIITQCGDEYIAVAAGEAGKAFSGMIKMNKTAGFIANQLSLGETDLQSIVNAMLEKYDVDESTARESAEKVISIFEKQGLIEK